MPPAFILFGDPLTPIPLSTRTHRRFLSAAGLSADAEADFDQTLFDWSIAERVLSELEDGPRMLRIQRPPLAFNDELARAAAKEAGCAWYFSIADFESALLDGIFVLKPTSSGPFSRSNTSTTIKITAEEMARYSPITVDLTKGESGQYTVKPNLNREASPSSVIG